MKSRLAILECAGYVFIFPANIFAAAMLLGSHSLLLALLLGSHSLLLALLLGSHSLLSALLLGSHSLLLALLLDSHFLLLALLLGSHSLLLALLLGSHSLLLALLLCSHSLLLALFVCLQKRSPLHYLPTNHIINVLNINQSKYRVIPLCTHNEQYNTSALRCSLQKSAQIEYTARFVCTSLKSYM